MNSFPTRSLAPALKTLMTYHIQHCTSKAPQVGLALSSLTFVWCLQSLTVPWDEDHNAHFTGGKIEIWAHVQDRRQVTCQISEPHSVFTELGSCHGSGWLRDTLQSPRNPQTHNEKGEQGATGWPVGGTRGLAVLLIQLDPRYTEACEFFVQIHRSSSEVPPRLLPCCVLRLQGHQSFSKATPEALTGPGYGPSGLPGSRAPVPWTPPHSLFFPLWIRLHASL